jgi:hypothetical protein
MTKIKCLNCDTLNIEANLFCEACGSKFNADGDLILICPNCLEKFPSGTSFCGKDGSKLMNLEKKTNPPKLVSKAIMIFAFTTLFGVIINIIKDVQCDNGALVKSMKVPFNSATMFFTLALLGAIFLLIYNGKNYARIILLVMMLIGLPIVINILINPLKPIQNVYWGYLYFLVAIVTNTLQIYATVLLFKKENNIYFKRRKN